jgi:hypothetical protein
MIKAAAIKQVNQRGNQFRIKDRQFLVYMRKFPLHTQKQPNEAGGNSLGSARNSEVSSTRNLSAKNGPGVNIPT